MKGVELCVLVQRKVVELWVRVQWKVVELRVLDEKRVGSWVLLDCLDTWRNLRFVLLQCLQVPLEQ